MKNFVQIERYYRAALLTEKCPTRPNCDYTGCPSLDSSQLCRCGTCQLYAKLLFNWLPGLDSSPAPPEKVETCPTCGSKERGFFSRACASIDSPSDPWHSPAPAPQKKTEKCPTCHGTAKWETGTKLASDIGGIYEVCRDPWHSSLGSAQINEQSTCDQCGAMKCRKCGSEDIYIRWHACGYSSNLNFRPPDSEHMHYSCRGCGFEWFGAPLDAEPAPAVTSEEKKI
jgi:hypothetical protein